MLPMTTREYLVIVTPAISIGAPTTGTATDMPSDPKRTIALFVNTMSSPSVARTIIIRSPRSSGRSSRSMANPRAPMTTNAARMANGNGIPASDEKDGADVRPEHQQPALREVHEADRPVDQRKAQGDQRIDRPDRESTVDDLKPRGHSAAPVTGPVCCNLPSLDSAGCRGATIQRVWRRHPPRCRPGSCRSVSPFSWTVNVPWSPWYPEILWSSAAIVSPVMLAQVASIALNRSCAPS